MFYSELIAWGRLREIREEMFRANSREQTDYLRARAGQLIRPLTPIDWFAIGAIVAAELGMEQVQADLKMLRLLLPSGNPEDEAPTGIATNVIEAWWNAMLDLGYFIDFCDECGGPAMATEDSFECFDCGAKGVRRD